MRAVVYKGPFEVAVENVLDPKLQHPNDAIVKITSSCICGSDLHMYEGRTAAQAGIVFGHENMGIIQEVGAAVKDRKVGDRVVMPFNVACGFCKNCLGGFTGFCITVNPGFAGGAYGYVAMGPYPGGQAEYLRVPFADFNCLLLPSGKQHEADYALLADIFPTGYHGAELAGVKPGESVVVFGAGPVGLMAAYSCLIRGAAEVYSVDHVKERLDKAAEIGAIPINYDEADPVQQIKDRRGGLGTDKGIDAVGYQATSAGSSAAGGEQDEVPNIVLNQLIETVAPTGALGIPGLYVPSDPGGVDENAKKGALSINFGRLFEKGLRLGTGQCNVKQYNAHLRDLITAGRPKPSFVVSHEIPLDDAPDAYVKFDKRVEGYTKVILNP
ncbi:MAG: glutathione-independent formaldehyde dehydrogenase [Chloroflexi bacterium]|nr:glutathione-independent formaldehyde dehydrogenase [Chloroflexota bacterium]